MQLDKLYPTVTTGDIDLTAGITSITDDRIKTDFFDPYIMGYLTPENAPICIRPMKYTLDGDSLDISPVDANIAWGYLSGSNEPYYTKTIYRTGGDAITQYNSGGGDRHLINAAEMAKVCLAANIEIYVTVLFIMNEYYVEGVGLDQLVYSNRNAGGIQGLTLTFNISDFLSMYKNGGTFINQTVRSSSRVSPIYNIDFPLNIDFNDMPKDGSRTLHIPFPEHDCVLLIQINGYNISDNTVISTDSAPSYVNIKPFSAYSFDNNKIAIIPGRLERNELRFDFNKSTLQISNLRSHSDSYYAGTPIDTIDGYLMGGFGIHITSDVLAPADATHNVIFGNTYTCGGVGGMGGTTVTFRMDCVFGIDDIYKYLLLFHKNTNTPSDSYSADDIVTIFNTADTPTLDTMSGSLSEIITRLRPWQIPGVDITTNDFTPDDIPDADSTMDEETGDSIIRPSSIVVGSTAGFLTQYVLTAANVAELGAALWSGIGDSNFWQNVLWTTLTASASFDVSSLLQYFISLRVYPFPLVNVSTYAGTGDNKIRIGRGAVPLTLGSSPNVGTISQYADILDAGSVQVPAYYGDFRDYAQTDVILHAPYIGTVNLAAADVIGATLHLVYAIDFAAGSCTAYLDISRAGFTYPVCLGSGVIGADVPLTADSASRRAAALFGLGDAALSNINQNASAERGAEGELDLEVNPYGMLAGAARGILGANPIAPTMSGIGKGFDSFAGAQTAYIQIRRAITKNPGNQDKTYGRQTARSARLGDLSGFTVCQNVDVSGLDCDLEIKNQIKRLLETGVYI